MLAQTAAATGPAIASDYPGTVKYMGSKRSLAPVVAEELARLTAPGDTLVDLFAGTHAIGFAMRHRNRVIGVDMQNYSAVIGRGLLSDSLSESHKGAFARLRTKAQANVDAVEDLYGRRIAQERRIIAALLAGTDGATERYAAFQISLPDPAGWSTATSGRGLTRHLGDAVAARRLEPCRFPYLMMSAYYANAYFGLGQAIWLDSLRYAIDELYPPGAAGRDRCLLALMCAASHTTSTPGHFAMWRRARTRDGAVDLARYLKRDPLVYFQAKLDELEGLRPSQQEHLVLTGEARQMLNHDALQDSAAIYVDPPYSAVHYSRFYHVLEELCDYDYPRVYFGGRFPADRYVSPYSIKRDALSAIDGLLVAIAGGGWPVVISYGSHGLVSEAALVHACQRAFGNPGIAFRKVSVRHASLGRTDRGSRPTTELLITCTPSRSRRQHVTAADGGPSVYSAA